MRASNRLGWITWTTSKTGCYNSTAAVLVALAWCAACRSAPSPSLMPVTLTATSLMPANTASATSLASVTVPPVSATPVRPAPPTPLPTRPLTGYGVQPPTASPVNGYPAPNTTPMTPPTAVPTPSPTALVAPTVAIAANGISPANAANLRPMAPIAPPRFDGAPQALSIRGIDIGPILDSAFSLDGARLAIAKAYGVFVYDLHAPRPVRFIDAATAIPRRVFFTADSNRLLVSTHDEYFGVRGATFFDIRSGQRTGLIRLGESINGIDSTIARLSPDGLTLLVRQNNGAELFDAVSRRPLRFWPKSFLAATFAFSPDSRLFATGLGAVTVWELATHRVAFSATQSVTAAVQQPLVAFSPDGRLFVSTDTQRVVMWDVPHVRRLFDVPYEGALGFGDNPIVFAPNNQMLAIAGYDKVSAWRVPGGELALKTSGTGALFSPDSATLLIPTKDKRIGVWDVATGQQRRQMAGDAPQYAPDKRLLIQLSITSYAFADANSGQVQPAFFAVRPRFAPDGRLLDIADDGSVRLLDGSGQPVQTLSLRPAHSPLTGLAFLDDGRLVMAFGNGTLRLQTNDPELAENPLAAGEQGAWVYQVVAAPDGQSVLSASKDGTVARFTADDFTYDRHVTFGGQPGELTSTDVSRDGLTLAAGSSDGTVKLWGATSPALTPTRSFTGHTNWVWSVAFSPDGKQLASGSADQTVRLWDVATGATASVLFGHIGAVHSVAFSPDGSLLASGAWDGTVRLWDATSGALRRVLSAGPARVNQVAFSRDGRLVGAAVDDGTVRLWESATGRDLTTLYPAGGATWSIAFSPDGRRLAAAMNDGSAQLWEAP